MNMLQNLTKHRAIVGMAMAAAMMMSLAPAVSAQPNTFGLEYGTASGLKGQDLRTTISSIIKVALSLLGIIALVIVLIGGFQWMTAGGNEEKVTGARKMIFSGIIGLAIILSAYAITLFVLNQLAIATGSGSTFNP